MVMHKKVIPVLVLVVLAVFTLLVTSVHYKEKNVKLEAENQELQEQEEKLAEEGKKANLLVMPEGRQKRRTEGQGKDDVEAEKKLKDLTDDFLSAGFEYMDDNERIEHMRPYMTDSMFEIYQSPLLSGDSGESQVRCAGRVREKTVYHAEVENGKAVSVSRIAYTFQAEGQEEIVNDALIELSFIEQKDGSYLVDSQTIYALVN